MAERNWAEHDRRIDTDPTLDECRAMGRIHRAYGWAANPRWPEEDRKAAYYEGFNEENPKK